MLSLSNRLLLILFFFLNREKKLKGFSLILSECAEFPVIKLTCKLLGQSQYVNIHKVSK